MKERPYVPSKWLTTPLCDLASDPNFDAEHMFEVMSNFAELRVEAPKNVPSFELVSIADVKASLEKLKAERRGVVKKLDRAE